MDWDFLYFVIFELICSSARFRGMWVVVGGVFLWLEQNEKKAMREYVLGILMSLRKSEVKKTKHLV